VTFSIVARDPQFGTLGIAISTAVPCVGATCTYVEQGVGAIASQASTNPRLGTHGLRLLDLGLSPEAAITTLLNEDQGAAGRQVGAVDVWGRVFAYSGAECEAWFGHRLSAFGGEHQYSVQGNTLVSGDTIEAMAATFEAASALDQRVLDLLDPSHVLAAALTHERLSTV